MIRPSLDGQGLHPWSRRVAVALARRGATMPAAFSEFGVLLRVLLGDLPDDEQPASTWRWTRPVAPACASPRALWVSPRILPRRFLPGDHYTPRQPAGSNDSVRITGSPRRRRRRDRRHHDHPVPWWPSRSSDDCRAVHVRPSAWGGERSISSSSGARAAGPEPIVSCSVRSAPSRSSHTAAVIVTPEHAERRRTRGRAARPGRGAHPALAESQPACRRRVRPVRRRPDGDQGIAGPLPGHHSRIAGEPRQPVLADDEQNVERHAVRRR